MTTKRKVRIKITAWIKADYPDLKKRWYKGTIVGRNRKKDVPSSYEILEQRAYRVKLVGEKGPRTFYDDEIDWNKIKKKTRRC